MFKVTEVEINQIDDPFKILTGDRYELIFNLDVEEDDELFDDEGVQLRVIYVVEAEKNAILRYEFINAVTQKYIDIEMEDEEIKYVEKVCQEQIALDN